MKHRVLKSLTSMVAAGALFATTSCTMVDAPAARNANIPSPTMAKKRETAINERPDSVMYLPLGEDVLVPEVMDDGSFPTEVVGPFEFRGETLASALQLILAEHDVSLAFETEEGLKRRVTVSNLRGDLGQVVNQVCSLANLYCSYENGGVTVKDTQTFTVTLPPIGTDDETDFLDNVASGLAAIVGDSVPAPIVDPTTRTIVYSATQRTADIASRYFQRLRANTAMIVFETYIWEVTLNAGNSTGVNWDKFESFGKFNTSFSVDASAAADFTSPISIGIPTTQAIDGTSDMIEFLSQFGAVKTISQPQITVLSGSAAELRVADTQNYVSEIATTLSGEQSTTSVSTDSVDTGFTLTINSSWDKSTVYADVDIELTDVVQIDDFSFSDEGEEGGSTSIQLPQTSERQLTTQIRVRPGDSVLIGGLVRENDNFDKAGLGFMEPVLPTSRTTQTENLELVILLRPRVVIYTAANDKRYIDFANKKHAVPGATKEDTGARVSPATDEFGNVYTPATQLNAASASDTPPPATPPSYVPPSEPAITPDPAGPQGLSAGPMPTVEDVPPAVSSAPAETTSPVVSAPPPAPVSVIEAPSEPVVTRVEETAPASIPPAPEEASAANDGDRFDSGYVSRSSSYDSQPYVPSAQIESGSISYSSGGTGSYPAVDANPAAAIEAVYPSYTDTVPAVAAEPVYPAVSADQGYGSSMPAPAVPAVDSGVYDDSPSVTIYDESGDVSSSW